MKHRTNLLSLALVLLAGCASQPVESPTISSATLGETKNVHLVRDVYTAGQPTEADLVLAKAAGVRTVVNLRKPRELGKFDERGTVERLGLEYVLIPFKGPDELTDEIFEEAREALEGCERPLVLHCGSANRVGAVWIPWRVLDEGANLEIAVQEAKAIGLRSAEYEALAREYVARRL